MIFKRCVMVMVLGWMALLLLAGCQRMDKVEGSKHFQIKTPAVRQAQLAKINTWRIHGAFSIKQEGQKAQIASYSWNQIKKNYRIRISSMLNLYHIEIFREYGTVTLWNNTTHVSTAKTPEALMQNALGWSLPVSEMSDWIKGAPAKKAGRYEAQYDPSGHLILLRQAGWVLHFSAYKTHTTDVDFPKMILMERPGFSVKIVIINWLLPLEYKQMEVIG